MGKTQRNIQQRRSRKQGAAFHTTILAALALFFCLQNAVFAQTAEVTALGQDAPLYVTELD